MKMFKFQQMNDFLSSCKGKHYFPSKVQASEAAKRMRKGNRIVEPYECKYCSLFHLGGSKGDYRTNNFFKNPNLYDVRDEITSILLTSAQFNKLYH